MSGNGDPHAGPVDLADPFRLFDQWFAEAVAKEPADPTAVALASVGADGWPDVRMILLKGVDTRDAPAPQRGFLFYTNLGSTKGKQLAANPRASLCFHWKSLKRQIRISGTVLRVSDAEADAYFATRPRQAQIGAWASSQSELIESRAVLERNVEKYSAQFQGDVPRPEIWSGYRIVPLRFEFWRDRYFRLHDRFVFTRETPAVEWTRGLLNP